MENKKFERTVYSFQSFLKVDVAVWGNRLKEHHRTCMQEDASYAQRRAWFDCFNILQRELELTHLSPEVKKSVFIVFEYELPRERGRRPDVLILSGDNLIVLEFKGFTVENHAQIDQVKHYARDLRNYHEQSHSLIVVPILVLAGGNNVSHESDGVHVISEDQLQHTLEPFVKGSFNNITKWFESEYAPLPSLLQSA